MPARPAPSLWRLPAMLLLAGYTLGGFTGFFVTISSLPAWLAGRGTPEGLAGLVTTVLLVVTVGVQLLVPQLVQRLGLGPVLAGGLIALGAPSLLLLVNDGLGWVLGISAVRGVGFAVLTVVGSTMTARIVPVARRGEAIGIYGLAIAVPNLLAVPGGVALVAAGHFAPVAILGAVPLVSLLTVPALTRSVAGDPEPDGAADPAGEPDSVPADLAGAAGAAGAADPAGAAGAADPADPAGAAGAVGAADPVGAVGAADPLGAADPPPPSTTARAARRAAGLAAIGPAVVLMVVTLAGGGFTTYLPIARPDGALATVALLVWGVTAALARWRAGVLADRAGIGRLLPGSSAVTAAGMAVVVGGLLFGDGAGFAVTVIGAAVMGLGYGASQNLTLVAAFARARQRETATVSSVWNVGFDAGTAIGAALVGALTVVMAVPAALAVTALIVLASIPLAVRSARP